MAGNTKELRARMKRTTSTLQLTRAMGLVAASKIRRANEAMEGGREYAAALERVMRLLASEGDCRKSPFLRQREPRRTRLIVIAGDRGLAGGYNANVFRLAAAYPDAEVIPIGKRACERFGKPAVSSETFGFAHAARLAEDLCAAFAEERFDRLSVLFTRYHSVMAQEARVAWLLPLHGEKRDGAGTLFEPDALTVLESAVRDYVAGTILACVRESFASEAAARRLAMDSAGRNAEQMLHDLRLTYNRVRQGSITQEITEIVAGSGG